MGQNKSQLWAEMKANYRLKWAWIFKQYHKGQKRVWVNNWTNNDQNNEPTNGQNNMGNLASFDFFFFFFSSRFFF